MNSINVLYDIKFHVITPSFMSYLYIFGTLLFFSSINGYSNSKVKYGLTLFTKDDCFQIAYETEDDRDSWLMTMRALISTHRDARPMFRKC